MLVKEYRICMPLTTEEYRVGQLYMISKHSHQESEKGEGVEVVRNEPHEDPVHGLGQFTEKRVHLSSKLPGWARAVTPRIFYVTEKAWNYYPYTITGPCDRRAFGAEYTCSFLPKFSIYIETKYEDNCGDNESIFHNDKILGDHEVTCLDIAFDEIPERYYRSAEDPRYFSSVKTGRGPLREGWRELTKPIMCSYKLVTVKFEVWGLQTRVEHFVHKVIRDVLLIGHRQAFAWLDEWCEMTMEEVRQYERETQEATNELIGRVTPSISISEAEQPSATQSAPASAPSTPLSGDAPEFLHVPKDRPRKKSAPEMLTLPALRERSSAE
ncbi:cytoplasmic phosphatidylinositol transfer protein 1-like [Carettochelys insculpta]|uniref:cytoplasmic phosphatidylinositol transfer protein 1-like n=1 Tax=Carettochelys insculpta TaxID=44489 RepID=UPI003EC10A95